MNVTNEWICTRCGSVWTDYDKDEPRCKSAPGRLACMPGTHPWLDMTGDHPESRGTLIEILAENDLASQDVEWEP